MRLCCPSRRIYSSIRTSPMMPCIYTTLTVFLCQTCRVMMNKIEHYPFCIYQPHCCRTSNNSHCWYINYNIHGPGINWYIWINYNVYSCRCTDPQLAEIESSLWSIWSMITTAGMNSAHFSPYLISLFSTGSCPASSNRIKCRIAFFREVSNDIESSA